MYWKKKKKHNNNNKTVKNIKQLNNNLIYANNSTSVCKSKLSRIQPKLYSIVEEDIYFEFINLLNSINATNDSHKLIYESLSKILRTKYGDTAILFKIIYFIEEFAKLNLNSKKETIFIKHINLNGLNSYFIYYLFTYKSTADIGRYITSLNKCNILYLNGIDFTSEQFNYLYSFIVEYYNKRNNEFITKIYLNNNNITYLPNKLLYNNPNDAIKLNGITPYPSSETININKLLQIITLDNNPLKFDKVKLDYMVQITEEDFLDSNSVKNVNDEPNKFNTVIFEKIKSYYSLSETSI